MMLTHAIAVSKIKKHAHTVFARVLLNTKVFALKRSLGLFGHWGPGQPIPDSGQEQTCSAAAADNGTGQAVLSSL